MNSAAELFVGQAGRGRLAARLLDYARPRRWFRGKSRVVQGARVLDLVALDGAGAPLETAGSVLALLAVDYAAGEPGQEVYVVPLQRLGRQEAAAVQAERPHVLVLPADDHDGAVWVDGLATGVLAGPLLALMRTGARVTGEAGAALRGEGSPLLEDSAGPGPLAVAVPRAEQSNTNLVLGERVLLKVYRQASAGENPELEVGRYLTRRCQPALAPRVLGGLVHRGPDGQERSLAIAHEYLPNRGEAFSLALREVQAFFARAQAGGEPQVGRFLAAAGTLGRRTAELHLCLARGGDDPAFAPEPMTTADREAAVARVREMLEVNLGAARGLRAQLGAARAELDRLFDRRGQDAIAGVLDRFALGRAAVQRTRTHGDLHLGQVLVRADDTGDDFVIIDFEGEPARPLAERRAKGSPLRDVMGMVRSFDYVPEVAMRTPGPGSGPASGAVASWARLWTREVTAAYQRAYLAAAAGAAFLPADPQELSTLLGFYQLEKVVYEVGYEVNNRPDWVEIPVRGLASLLGLEGTV